MAPTGAKKPGKSAPIGANSSKNPSRKLDEKECTWCRARNFTFVGHLYTDCDKLVKYKEEQQRNKGRKRAAANQADDDVVEIDDDDGDDEETAFHAGVSAYAAKLPSDNASNSSWIFDYGTI